jgi:hypothetical protein
MNERQHLLDEARRFCNPTTGEVVELIPEQLMRLLRAAKLAVGIPGEASRTATSAKWIVFFNDDIRDQALTQWREAKRQRQRTKRRHVGATEQTPTSGVESPAEAVRRPGLRDFLRPRKPDA